MFETISDNKAQVDQLCMLSLAQPTAMDELTHDHHRIVDAIVERDEDAVIRAISYHLFRLGDVVAAIRETHSDYFED